MSERSGVAFKPQTRFWEKIALVAEITSLCRGKALSERAFRHVIELIQPMIPFDDATLYLCEHWDSSPRICAFIGTRIDLPNPFVFVMESALSEDLDDARQPILFEDSESISLYAPSSEFATIMASPLVIESRAIGLLVSGSYQHRMFSEQHVKLMGIISDQLALSVERQIHERRMEAKNKDLEKAHDELREAQEQIVEQEKLAAVTELAASINHEINNPLTTILGNTQYLRYFSKSDRLDLDKRLNRIEEAALRISDVNRKLLNIEKLVSQFFSGYSTEKMLDLNCSAEPDREDL